MTRTPSTTHDQTFFASPLLALGRTCFDQASMTWQEPAQTPGETVLSFPRIPLIVHPATGDAELLHPGIAAIPPLERAYQKRSVSLQGEESDWLWLSPEVASWLDHTQHGWRDTSRWLVRLPPGLLLRQRRLMAVVAVSGRQESSEHAKAEIEEVALGIVIALFDVGSPTSTGMGRAQRRLSMRARRYLCDHIHEPLELGTMAKTIGVSVPHLCVVFKAMTGCTVGQYSRFLRVCIALGRLELESSGDLTTLALALGFSSHSHFSARFRDAFGCTPREARQQLNCS